MNWWILMRPVIWVVVFGGVASVLAMRLVRVLERRMMHDVAMADLESRVAQLEEAVESAREETQRLRDGHEFMSRLLMERNPSGKSTEGESGDQW